MIGNQRAATSNNLSVRSRLTGQNAFTMKLFDTGNRTPVLPRRLIGLVSALVLAVAGCATSPEQSTVPLLQQAGFKALPASSFEKQQKLKSLKPDRLVTVKAASGTVYYVYPLHDQDLLYAGRAPEYSTYQNLLAAQRSRAAATKARQRRDTDAGWSQRTEAARSADDGWEEVWSAPSDF